MSPLSCRDIVVCFIACQSCSPVAICTEISLLTKGVMCKGEDGKRKLLFLRTDSNNKDKLETQVNYVCTIMDHVEMN